MVEGEGPNPDTAVTRLMELAFDELPNGDPLPQDVRRTVALGRLLDDAQSGRVVGEDPVPQLGEALGREQLGEAVSELIIAVNEGRSRSMATVVEPARSAVRGPRGAGGDVGGAPRQGGAPHGEAPEKESWRREEDLSDAHIRVGKRLVSDPVVDGAPPVFDASTGRVADVVERVP